MINDNMSLDHEQLPTKLQARKRTFLQNIKLHIISFDIAASNQLGFGTKYASLLDCIFRIIDFI